MPQNTTTTPSSVRLGIDGGGTKTDFILVDSHGKLLGQRRAPGSSPSLSDADTIAQLISENIHALVQSVGGSLSISHCCLCMAGSRLFWQDFAKKLAQRLPQLGQVHSFDDSIPILELATDGGPGLALHSGTGSFIAARGPDGAAHYAGGLGWRIGDPGSAQDLGRRAAERALLEAQGWATPSAFGRAVCDAIGANDIDALLREIYAEAGSHNSAAALAQLSPLVTKHAELRDAAAVAILRDSVSAIVQVAKAVSARLFGNPQEVTNKTNEAPKPIPVGLSGPILRDKLAQQTIAEALGPTHHLHTITEPPLEGLRRLLTRL